MKQILFSLCLFLSAPTLSNAQSNSPNDKDQSLTDLIINVTDERTNEPIKGARVYVPNFPDHGNSTDQNGQAFFSVKNGQPQYLIFVEADGYHNFSEKIIINEQITSIEDFFKLKPIVDFFDLRVKIIDEQTNEYIENAKVELIGKNAFPPQRDGSVVVFKNVPIDQSHIVTVEHEEYKTFYSPSPDNPEDEKEITINARLERDHFPVEIIVRNAGAPLRNASVNFLGFSGEEFETKTNKYGKANFPSIKKGFKQIEISKRNFYTLIKPITIAKKDNKEINQFSYSLQEIAAPDSLIIEGRIVIEGTNMGLQNAAVRLKNNFGIHSYFTNEKGEFQMSKKIAYEDLRDFAFFLTLEHSDYRPFTTKELKVSHIEFLRNLKKIDLTIPDSYRKVTHVPVKLSHNIFNEKYIKECDYKVNGKWKFGKYHLMNEGETVYLVLHAPDFWEEVRLVICTPKKMFGDVISRKDIEIKGNKNYKIKLYKNKKGKQCDSDE